MRRFQRLIALLLLIIFVPATVMAGPLRLCLGQDGHRAVEFLHGSDHHVTADQAPQTAESFGAKAPPSCVDLTLLSASVTSASAQVHAKPVSFDGADQPSAMVAFTDFGLARSYAEYRPTLRRGFLAAHPQLVQLRTVILVI